MKITTYSHLVPAESRQHRRRILAILYVFIDPLLGIRLGTAVCADNVAFVFGNTPYNIHIVRDRMIRPMYRRNGMFSGGMVQ